MAEWKLNGNAGTNPEQDFLGTTDNQPLVIKTSGLERMRVSTNGNVGIGTLQPVAQLHITSPNQGVVVIQTLSGGEPPALQLVAGDGQAWNLYSGGAGSGTFSIMDTASGSHRLVIDPNGNVGIGTLEPQERLHVNGNILATGDVILTGADCAEDFEIDESCLSEAEPGTVMVLDDDGRLRPSETAFDKRVAGVVSCAGNCKPGIILNHQLDRAWRRPLALVGKVYCKVDASLAPIAVGDLLTTSTTPGHAMKAADPLQSFGAVLGKALRPLKEGCGLIPVLVALQ